MVRPFDCTQVGLRSPEVARGRLYHLIYFYIYGLCGANYFDNKTMEPPCIASQDETAAVYVDKKQHI
jgi:hypothetical protein